MALIDELEAGTFADFGKPDRVIDTLLSKVFLFGPKAVKVYKHKEAFYGNLADPEFRKSFFEEDFFWNRAMSPEIYLSLNAVKGTDGSEDFYIEMNAIDTANTLTNLFEVGLVSKSHMSVLTEVMVRKIRELTQSRREKLTFYFEKPWRTQHLEALEDLRSWSYMAEGIAREETDAVVNVLIDASRSEPYFETYDQAMLSVSIDTNVDNLLLIEGKPGFIDIMPPKDNWKVADERLTITRAAVDAYVLGGKELGDAVYETYRTFRADPPPVVRLIYEIRSAMIQWAYREILGQSERAAKYRAFTLGKLAELKGNAR